MIPTPRSSLSLATALAILFVISALPALAVGTRTWRITAYKDFDEGESDGVLLSSSGEARTGWGTSRIDVPVAQVFSSVTLPDGAVLLGTGDQGDLYLWEGKGEAKKLCRLEGVLVSALAVGADGTAYAGTLPGGKVWEVKARASAPCRELAKLEGADQVWALSVDANKKQLVAATGPGGKLFTIELPSGKQKVLWDSGEKHLLSLARGKDGALLVGSAEEAILYRVDDNGKARALHDFAGDEVRAIAVAADAVYVAVNEFEKKTLAGTAAATARPHGTKIVLPTATIAAAGSLPPGRERKGKGAVFRIEPDGRVEQLHALADGYFTALHLDKDGDLFAAAGANGRVYLIRPDRTLITAFNFPERQILTLALDGAHPAIGTGDAGALYAIDFAAPPKTARYFSKVLDAGTAARWGAIRYAEGGSVAIDTRSGNTARPDRSWSDWQSPSDRKKANVAGREIAEGKIGSPPGRYLQFRAGLGKASSLRDVALYYLPQNQRARVTEITAGEDPGSGVARAAKVAPGKPRSPLVKIRWKVENPDDDELVFRLFYREEGDPSWRPLGGPDPLTTKEWEWNTEAVPDGSYLLKAVASDERSNARGQSLEHELVSTPYLIDNRKPEIQNLSVAWPNLGGTAKDSYSAIADLAYSIDGGDFQPIAPKDGILDEPKEDFVAQLPGSLTAGSHTLTVRAVDAADNAGLAQTTFRVGPNQTERGAK